MCWRGVTVTGGVHVGTRDRRWGSGMHRLESMMPKHAAARGGAQCSAAAAVQYSMAVRHTVVGEAQMYLRQLAFAFACITPCHPPFPYRPSHLPRPGVLPAQGERADPLWCQPAGWPLRRVRLRHGGPGRAGLHEGALRACCGAGAGACVMGRCWQAHCVPDRPGLSDEHDLRPLLM